MVYVICDFLNAYGFNGIKFHVYDGDDNDIETMTDDDKIVGFVGCDEVVDITYSNKRGRMVGHYYFDFNDPELFVKLIGLWVLSVILHVKGLLCEREFSKNYC